MTAYAAFTGCFAVLIVINGASLWKGFHSFSFLSSYMIVSQLTRPLEKKIFEFVADSSTGSGVFRIMGAAEACARRGRGELVVCRPFESSEGD